MKDIDQGRSDRATERPGEAGVVFVYDPKGAIAGAALAEHPLLNITCVILIVC